MSEYIDENAQRKELVKSLILRLHAGEEVAAVKGEFLRLVRDISPVEIAHIEQELIDEGLPVEQVQALCDVHVAVFQDALDEQAPPEMTPGHPVHTFKYENWAVSELLPLIEQEFAKPEDMLDLHRLRTFASQLAEVTKIYTRKENLLFPFLEHYGVVGPSKVMWSTHDDIRAQLKLFRAALDEGRVESARELFAPLAEEIRQMIYKEEKILFPTALKLLNDADWLAIANQSDEVGYCLIRPGTQWKPVGVEPAEAPGASKTYVAVASKRGAAPEGGPGAPISLDTGSLTPEQLNLLLTHLPIDVTLIDETDTVRYFSQGNHERIFLRTPSVIGRKVQNCHPPKSVDVVERLLEEFKAGERDSADFWLQMQGMFVLIRYVALRDANGRYCGTIEITQDIAPLRDLEGERRLLDEGN